MSCEDYLKIADEVYGAQGETQDGALAAKFLQGITNPIVQSVTHGQLNDDYTYEQVREAFI